MFLKECVFVCEGKITLFSFLKKTVTRYMNSGYCLFFWGSNRLLRVVFFFFLNFGEKYFINKAQFGAEFTHRLILKDGVVPVIKDPGHDSEPETVI